MSDLTLYELEPSPNNIKVRLALHWKGIPFQRVPISGADRSAVRDATGQEFTPAITHGGTVLFDSHAILRYIDCNWRDTGGRLYPLDRDELRKVEGWERHAFLLQAAIGTCFGQMFAGSVDPEITRGASKALTEATHAIDEALDGRPHLHGNDACASDFVLAPFVWYGCMTEEQSQRDPIRGFMHQHLVLGDGLRRAREWSHRVMGLDVPS